MREVAYEHRRASTGEITKEEFQAIDKKLSDKVNMLFDSVVNFSRN